MDRSAARYDGFPTRRIEAGGTLISEGSRGTDLYVLLNGTVEVRRGGQLVTTVSVPGSFLGEIAALLDEPHGADVVARGDVEVVVVAAATEVLAAHPALTMDVARLLARRLRAVTSYLGDLKRQYGGADGHLGMMDQVLSELVSLPPGRARPGSEREDVPDY